MKPPIKTSLVTLHSIVTLTQWARTQPDLPPAVRTAIANLLPEKQP